MAEYTNLPAEYIFHSKYCRKNMRNFEYLECLKDAIVSEYREKGFCTLIDNLLEERKRINRIDFFAMQWARAVLTKEESCIPLEYVGYENLWYSFEEIVVFLKKVKAAGQKSHLEKQQTGISEKTKDALKEELSLYLEKERKEFKHSVESEVERMLKGSREALGSTEKFHDEMCMKTNEAQAVWMQSISAMMEQLVLLKDDFHKNLKNWQVGLYPKDLLPIAERYVDLYRILQIDKVIGNEILKESLDSMEGHGGYDASEVITYLQRLNQTLHIFMRKLESALGSLGMYVFYPKEGDSFDPVWHVLKDDSLEMTGGRRLISECVIPGIAKRLVDDAEDDVIIPAVVQI